MATEHTRRSGRLRRPLAALSRLSRLGDIPVVVMLAWAGWLAVPWSFSGLAQARAAAAAAADAEPPHLSLPSASDHAHLPADRLPATSPAGPSTLVAASPPVAASSRVTASSSVAAWSLPAARAVPFKTLRECAPAGDTDPAMRECAGEGTAYLEPSRGAALLDVRGRVGQDLVAVERARIAGEVHDAAGHGLAAIALQAGLALVTFDDDPEQARASLQAIKETSTTALAQLRAALDGIDPPGGDLPGLIDGVRAAGLPVDVEPAAFTVPVHLQGTVYRVVRESLTNVLRHAGPTRALVRVTGDSREFVLEVADRGTGCPGPAEGRGLAGMRTKVTEAGGHFTAGPREGGGFRVVARFPQVSV